MLKIKIPAREFYDEEKDEIVLLSESAELCFEHSLESIEKWEEKYCRAFLTDEQKTEVEMLYYIQCMLINNTEENIHSLKFFRKTEYDLLHNYMNSRHCATYIQDKKDDGQSKRKDKTTAELVYYHMIQYNIPFECKKWNYYKLMALIYICGVKEAEENKRANKSKGYPGMPKMPGRRRSPRGF